MFRRQYKISSININNSFKWTYTHFEPNIFETEVYKYIDMLVCLFNLVYVKTINFVFFIEDKRFIFQKFQLGHKN